ncbi:LysR substrate-binding domain-containing protein [Trinickia fusca]|uniref:LysR substrate-binding domain-containing protein n=1 Tax=Trinickia fusca TaxID=2419777 RepID=UPI001602769A|nr:LysR substrate-binding domain-containing protein [Trinickia fusca]
MISTNNIPLNALRAFEAAARLGSFKAAAAELFVTPAAVSQQVQALESYLGTSLFERLNRAVRLTATGAALASEVSAAFARLETALMAAAPAETRTRNTLVISAVPSFASRWLAPRLDRFQQRHPQIDLQLMSSETLVDLAADGHVDIALRYGPGPYGDLHAERLWFDDIVIPVCSPELRAKLPAGQAWLDESMPVTLLRVALPSSSRAAAERPGNVWTAWLAATGHATPAWLAAAESGPLYGVTHLAIEAAIAGRGIALAPRALVADDLAAGRLERVGTAAAPDVNSFWLLCRKENVDRPGIRAFADWIRGEIAAPYR